MVKWLVDPSDHHPDDEERLRTGIKVEDGNNEATSGDDDDEDDTGGDEDDEEPLDGAAVGATRAPQRKARKEKSAEQKETERKVAEAQQQVKNS